MTVRELLNFYIYLQQQDIYEPNVLCILHYNRSSIIRIFMKYSIPISTQWIVSAFYGEVE